MLKTITCLLFFSVSGLATPEELAQRVINHLVEKKKIKEVHRIIDDTTRKIYSVQISTNYFEEEFNELNRLNQITEFLIILDKKRQSYQTIDNRPFFINFNWQQKKYRYFKEYEAFKSDDPIDIKNSACKPSPYMSKKDHDFADD